jgi:uncharacterized protein YjbI with pentapeptide repeats
VSECGLADHSCLTIEFLEDMSDLKGLDIFQEQFDFSGGDTFEAIDFSFAEFWHSRFSNAVFNCSIAFARVYNCEFRRCIFSFNHSYGTTFEKCRFVECEFVERTTPSRTAASVK